MPSKQAAKQQYATMAAAKRDIKALFEAASRGDTRRSKARRTSTSTRTVAGAHVYTSRRRAVLLIARSGYWSSRRKIVPSRRRRRHDPAEEAGRGRTAVVAVKAKWGADAKGADASGATPLHKACAPAEATTEAQECVKVLVENAAPT